MVVPFWAHGDGAGSCATAEPVGDRQSQSLLRRQERRDELTAALVEFAQEPVQTARVGGRRGGHLCDGVRLHRDVGEDGRQEPTWCPWPWASRTGVCPGPSGGRRRGGASRRRRPAGGGLRSRSPTVQLTKALDKALSSDGTLAVRAEAEHTQQSMRGTSPAGSLPDAAEHLLPGWDDDLLRKTCLEIGVATPSDTRARVTPERGATTEKAGSAAFTRPGPRGSQPASGSRHHTCVGLSPVEQDQVRSQVPKALPRADAAAQRAVDHQRSTPVVVRTPSKASSTFPATGLPPSPGPTSHTPRPRAPVSVRRCAIRRETRAAATAAASSSDPSPWMRCASKATCCAAEAGGAAIRTPCAPARRAAGAAT